MKVIHLLSTNFFSGAENVVCQIIELYRDDKKTEMFYCSPYGTIENTLKDKNIKYLKIKKLSLREIKHIVSGYNPDIIHSHDIKATILASFFYKKCRIISHIHGNSKKMKKISLKSLLFLLASRKSEHIFWVSNSSFLEYKFQKKVACKSSVLPNVISMDNVLQRSIEKCEIKSDIIFVGRLVDIKNPHRLIDVFSKIVTINPKLFLTIVGNGPLEQEIKEEIESKKIDKNVRMLGFQKNPYKYMKNSKIMIMTSKFEGTPMCVLEALTLGLPIISTPTDGLVDIITQDKNGFLSNDNQELANKICNLLSDDKKIIEMSNNAKETAKNINDVKKYKQELDVYY